jgi:hypothetical protein
MLVRPLLEACSRFPILLLFTLTELNKRRICCFRLFWRTRPEAIRKPLNDDGAAYYANKAVLTRLKGR